MSFRYPRHRITEMVQAPKRLSDGQVVSVESHDSHGVRMDVTVDLMDGPFTDLRFIGRAGRKEEPETYEAAFLLDQQRVRGVGYSPVARQNFRAKLRIPAGWHQNICDPNVTTDHPDWNRHETLPDFAPTDFMDFLRKTAALWNIDLGMEEELL